MKRLSESKNRELLVLTCSVEARADSSSHARKEKSVRLKDYQSSINSWITLARENNWDICVLENSGHTQDLLEGLKLSQFEKIDSGQIKFVACELDTVSAKNGISQGEFNMLHEALIPQLGNYDFIWKATGRTFVENVPQLRQTTTKPDLVVELTFIPYVSANSRFFGMKVDLWQQFLQPNVIFCQGINSSYTNLSFESMEEYLTFFTLKKMHERKRVDLFEQILMHRGSSGSKDKVISNRKRRFLLILLNPIRPLLRKLLMGIVP